MATTKQIRNAITSQNLLCDIIKKMLKRFDEQDAGRPHDQKWWDKQQKLADAVMNPKKRRVR